MKKIRPKDLELSNLFLENIFFKCYIFSFEMKKKNT